EENAAIARRNQGGRVQEHQISEVRMHKWLLGGVGAVAVELEPLFTLDVVVIEAIGLTYPADVEVVGVLGIGDNRDGVSAPAAVAKPGRRLSHERPSLVAAGRVHARNTGL